MICREVVFTYNFGSLDSFDEGFELSLRNHMNGAERWIPLWFFSVHEPRTVHDISLGDITDEGLLNLQGYAINFTASENNNISVANIKLCGPMVFGKQEAKGLFNWQFRWLQTVANGSYVNNIYIYNISITVVNDTQQVPLLLFQDDFSKGDELR